MERRTEKYPKSHTPPSSPTHSFSSSSSSDFEFTISISPRMSTAALCPADELFYKGQLLPLHLSRRLSMVSTLLLASSSPDTTTTASRDSTGSSNSNDSHVSSFSTDLFLLAPEECDSSRPSSFTEDDHEFKRFNLHNIHHQTHIKKAKYFSLSRFSSVFRKETKTRDPGNNISGSSVKRMSARAKEVTRKYLKKVKPLYEKLSQKQQQKMSNATTTLTTRMVTSSANVSLTMKPNHGSMKDSDVSIQKARKEKDSNGSISHSFSWNLRYPRRRSCVSSCPSSMRSSPSHSGILSRNGLTTVNNNGRDVNCTDTSSMEELQSAIQGAIAHCKNSMIQNKTMVRSE